MTNLSSTSPRKPALLWVAEVFSIFSAAGFLMSAWLQDRVFASWGLYYYQIATPADVVMGGLGILISAAVVLPWVLVGLLVASAAARITTILKIPGTWIDVLVALCVMITLAFFWADGFLMSDFSAAALLIAYGAATTWILYRLYRRFSEKRFRTATLAAVLGALSLSLGIAGGERVQYGFASGLRLASAALPEANQLPEDCNPPRIVWMGQRALVTACEARVWSESRNTAVWSEVHYLLISPNEHLVVNRRRLEQFQSERAVFLERESRQRVPAS